MKISQLAGVCALLFAILVEVSTSKKSRRFSLKKSEAKSLERTSIDKRLRVKRGAIRPFRVRGGTHCFGNCVHDSECGVDCYCVPGLDPAATCEPDYSEYY